MVRIPRALHEAFGEEQEVGDLIIVLMVGALGTAALVYADHAQFLAVGWWRATVAAILVFDVLAGCVANFTRGTNSFYAARAKIRWIFIAVHVHLPLVGWLLGADLWPLLLIWVYTIASASVVNLTSPRRQTFIGGVLLAVGLVIVAVLPHDSVALLVTSMAFLLKVGFAFAVNHYRESEANIAS